MSLLGAVAVDFAEQLKKRTKGWTVTPLVILEDKIGPYGLQHNDFIFVKKTPHSQSPTDFYTGNPPIKDWTFLQIKQSGKPLRVISLKLEATTNFSVHIGFWRANGYVQNDDAPRKRRFARYQRYNGGVEGYDALLMCQIHHVGPKVGKGHRQYHKHSFDLTVPEVPGGVLDVVCRVIDKSYQWWGRGRKECFGHYQFPLMVCLEGKNYNADEHHVR